MRKFLSAILASIILTCSIFTVSASPSFPDVNESDWFYDAVTEAAERGIMNGMDGGFSPNGKMTRAQLVTVLARLSGADVTGKRSLLPFSDTPASEWYADYIGWGVEAGIAGGYEDGTFRPEAPVLRQELAAFIVRYLAYSKIYLPEAPLLDGFSDTDQIPEWAAKDAESLRLTGLIGGDGGRFNPKGETTRAEFATVVVRYYALLPTARDIMYERLENLNKYVDKKMGRFYIQCGASDWMTAENIGSALLPMLKLDMNIYEYLISDEEIERIVITENYANISIGQTHSTSFPITIRNKITGEVTETKNFTFLIEKVEFISYVDPDDFDPGIDTNKYSAMMDRSLVQFGDLSRLTAAFAKAEKGENITVAYIGGSITEGAGGGSDGCYARISCNWLAKRFPDITVNYVNAGVSGTPSLYGNMRIQRDVLAHDPDIVFVEFSVNDSPSALYTETYESLVRTVLTSEKSPSVVLLFSSIDPDNKSHIEEQHIGEFYDLPMINVGSAVIPAIEEGLFTTHDYTEDGTHPSKWGHQIYSDTIEHFYREARNKIAQLTEAELKINPVRSDTYTEARFVNLTFMDKDTFEPDSLGSWKELSYGGIPAWIRTGVNNDPLVFTFTGTNIFIRFIGGDEIPHLLISIDDGDEIEIYSEGDQNSIERLLTTLDTYSEHTVSVRVRNNDLRSNAYILAFAVN